MKETVKIFGVPVYSRSVQTGSLSEPSEKLIAALGGGSTASGVSITSDTAITLSAVWRAINVVGGTLAFLPLQVHMKNQDGGRDTLSDHHIQELLDNPTDDMPDFNFRQTLQAFKMLWGNGYAYIKRDETTGRPKELALIHPDNCEPVRTPDGIYYHVRIAPEVYSMPARNIIHIRGLGFDGLKGKSVIAIQRESLGLAKAAERYGARFFGSGGNMDGVIEVPSSLKDDVYKRLRESWNDAYHGLDNSHKTAILEAGAVYKRIGIPPEDAQFLATRKFQINEIARWFGVQPHLLMDLERSTNNNIEHQGMEFVLYTLAPDIAMWESELKRKLFTKEERRRHYVEFNINALLRADSRARSDYYKGMFAVGAMNPNRIRQLENESAYEGGNQYYVQAGYVPVDLIREVYSKKLNADNNENPLSIE